jgi:hypothetical protein
MNKKIIKLKKRPVGHPPDKLESIAARADKKVLINIKKKIEKRKANKSESDNTTDDIIKKHEYFEFIYWLSTPIDLREIKTHEEFAKKIGVSKDTLTDWKKREGFQDLLMETIKTTFRERSAGVLRAVERRAHKSGGNQDAALYFKVVGMVKDQSEIKLGVDEDLKKALDKVSNDLPD